MENEWPMPMQNDIRKVRVSAALVGEIVYTSAQIYIYIYIYRERERERRERGTEALGFGIYLAPGQRT